MTGALLERPKRTATDDLLIRASAGTGKTFQLSNRYLVRLFDGVPVDRILATTFTRKAAGEILERILVRLARAVSDDSDRAELAGHLDRPLSEERCRRALRDLVRQLHRVRVCTLDSFFSQIAKSHTLELGLPPGWEVADDQRASQLVGRSVEAVLHDEAIGELVRIMHLLTRGDASRAVAASIRAVVDRLHGLYLESDDEAWHRFSKPRFPTADEWSDLLDELESLPLPNDKNWGKAREKDLQNAREENWEWFAEKGIGKQLLWGLDTYYGKPIEPRVRDVYARLIDVARAHVVEWMRRQTETTWELLAKFDAAFDRISRGERLLRFEDVTRRLADGLEVLDPGRLGHRLDGGVDHLLLDEFQDTSIAQWKVVREFARRIAGNGPERTLFAVGDVKQAIYGWRGGIAEIFDALEFEFPGVGSLALNESHRSAPPVIEAVNAIFGAASEQDVFGELQGAVRGWCRAFAPHETAKTNFDGYVTLATAPVPEERETPEDVAVREAVRTVEEIVRRAPGRSVGVLVRQNKVVGRVVHALRRRGIPASEENGNPLVDSAAVGLVVSLMKLADHPGSTAPRFHVATSPIAADLGFTDHTDNVAATRLAESIRRDLVTDGYGAVVLGWARLIARHSGERDADRLRQLVKLAHGYEPFATLRARDFVDFVAHERVTSPSANDVRVMTIHGAKGLQFDAVVLPELELEFFNGRESHVVGRPHPTDPPERVCLYRNAAIQRMLPPEWQAVFAETAATRTRETLCLLYVAVTRAVHELRMIVQPEGKDKKTAAGLLRAALGGGRSGTAGTTLYEIGDPDWAASSPRDVGPDPSTALGEKAPSPLRIALAPMPEGRKRGLARIAPSGLGGRRRVKLHDLLHVGGAEARDRGTLLHAWFERIEWLDDRTPDDADLRRVAEELAAPPEIVPGAIEWFREMLRHPAVAFTLSKRSYDPPRDLPLPEPVRRELAAGPLRLEVQTERRFAVREGSAIVSGSIDRLVLLFRGTTLLAADVLDFKTDRLDPAHPATIAEKVEHYRAQLAAYRPAVATMYRLDPERIAARLVLLSIGRIENV